LGTVDLQVAYLLLIIGVDTLLGVMVAHKTGQLNLRDFSIKTFRKLAIYLAAMVLFHAFDQVASLPGTARWLCLVALAGIELMSSLKNIANLGYTEVAEALQKIYEDLYRRALSNPQSRTPVSPGVPGMPKVPDITDEVVGRGSR